MASEVHDHIRGLSPFPGAWFELGGARVKALRSTKGEGSGAPGTVLDDRLTIACGDGAVRLTQVQRAGKQPMSGGGIPARHAGESRRAAELTAASGGVETGPMVAARLDEFGEIVVGDLDQVGVAEALGIIEDRDESPASAACVGTALGSGRGMILYSG